MDIAELLGRGKSATDSDLLEDLAVPDYPPADDSEDSAILDGDLLEPDPAPRRDKKALKVGGALAKKATQAQKRQISDAVEFMLITLGGGLAMRDPHCGGAIADNASNIATRATPLIARNPAWVAWFCGSTGFLDVMGLLMALQPVAATIWGHHVTHTVSEEGGKVDLSQFTAPDL
jgi:hypothetical protein